MTTRSAGTRSGKPDSAATATAACPKPDRGIPRPAAAAPCRPSGLGPRRWDQSRHQRVPPRADPRRSPEQRRQERVAEAAVVDALGSTWRDAVADRAADYISDTTWRRLTRGNHRRQCRALAKIAGVVLRWKQEMHAAIGSAAGALMFRLTGSRAARAFARELAANIPLPIDAKLTAVARCTQAVGVLLCVSRGDDLTRCQCFIDLALAETKTQVKKILLAAAASWTQMATYPTPTATTLVRDK